MDVLYAADDLLEDLAGFLLGHTFATDDVVEELSVLHELHHQEEMLWSLNDLVKLDDVGMPYELQNVDFSGHSFDVCHVHNLVLF